MKKLFGLRITQGTVNYFISAPDQALPQHQDAVNAAFASPDQDNWTISTNPQLCIKACRVYADIAPYVVLEDIAPQDGMNFGIFTTKWVPETPIPLECDHLGRHRFKVLDFAENDVEANNIVQTLKQQQ